MALATLLTDEVRAMLGTTVSYTAPEPLSRASIRYFATAIGADPGRWRDEAPPTLICETAQLTGRAVPDENSYLGQTWELPLPVPCAMFRGGNDYRFVRPARPDDLITTSWSLSEAVERRDSAGDPLVLVTAVATYSADAGNTDVIATNTETMIFRPVARTEAEPSQATRQDGDRAPADASNSEATAADPDCPAVGEKIPPLARRIELSDMVAYGAATWDWHRLHYDPAHARRLGASAPLVDGQMLGALLAEQVLRFAGTNARLTRLRYRNRAPVVAGETVICAGQIASVDESGFSADLSISVDSRVVVAPAFVEAEWTRGSTKLD